MSPSCSVAESSAACLQDQALLALSTLPGQQGRTGGRLKDFTDALVGLGRAFEIFVGTDLLTNFLALNRSSSAFLFIFH